LREFQKRIPALAQGLTQQIERELAQNANFNAAFKHLWLLCQKILQPTLSEAAVKELLVQHLLTERFLQSFFIDSAALKHNLLGAELAKVSEMLEQRGFKCSVFLHELAEFYEIIEAKIQQKGAFTTKQALLDAFYEGFLQSFAPNQADTHGIIYTPQPIVDFMWNSVETILQHEFNLTLNAPTVQILDPCVGTGNFLLNLLNRLSREDLQRKYENEIFCNEVLLLSYYIAALNIEHCYFERMKQYRTYPGIGLVDTLNLAESPQLAFFNEEKSERVARQKAAPLTVIIGNPPYNVGQQNENDNNKNRKYAVIDSRIRETYAKASRATNKNALSDAYVKFFRWAVDRLDDQDGLICFVSNNGFLDGIAFDGFRQHLLQDFTQVYHLDLHGNVRKNPKLSGTTHNVFGIQVGVGITIAIRNRRNPTQFLRYFRLPEDWRKEEKFAFLTKSGDVRNIAWQVLQPDAKNNWLTEGFFVDFAAFLPLGTKEAKASKNMVVETIFKTYSMGVGTSRDAWMYDFAAHNLAQKAHSMIETYNTELARWLQAGCPSEIDEFVLADAKKIKWSSRLKECFARKIQASFAPQALRHSLYRPFTHQYLYFDEVMTHRRAIFPKISPTPASEAENMVICLSARGNNKPFQCLVTKIIPDFHLTGDTQCFPFYTYAEDGSNRQENITAWAVKQFEAHYGPDLLVAAELQPPLTREGPLPELAEGKGLQVDSTKKAIFCYVYALLQHPLYRERYQEKLKRELPRLPLVGDRQTFLTLVAIGQKLADLHLNYETVAEYPLAWVENKQVPWTWRVEKMKLTKDKAAIIVNRCLTLKGLPASAFEYQLGQRSALEWVIKQYQITTDQRSGITNDPNRADEPQYIVHLIGKVITVSVETVKLVERLQKEILL